MPPRRTRPLAPEDTVAISLDGETHSARAGEPLAAALFAAGVRILGRSVKYHRPRGAPCGAGDCSHCLVRADGLPNLPACRLRCHDGLEAERQNVVGSAERDLLAATDWLFPWGLDHHEMFTGVPLIQGVVQKVVRKLSGLGRLPDAPLPESHVCHRDVEVLVVGAGPAGMAAAREAVGAGVSTLLLESDSEPGGRYRTGLWGPVPAAPELETWTDSTAVMVDRDAGLTVLVERPGGLVRVRPRRVVFATGSYATPGLFENNDLPGVMDADWVCELVARWGVLPGESAVLCGDDPEAEAVAAQLESAGVRVVRRLPAAAVLGGSEPRLLGARGPREVTAALVEDGADSGEVDCELVVLCLPRAPAFELPASAGAGTRFSPRTGGFEVDAGDDGRTRRPEVYACGSVTGTRDPEHSAASGARAGRAVVEDARAA